MRCAAVVLVAIGCSSKQPAPESLVDRWAAAIGGRPALTALGSIHVEGKVVIGGLEGRVDTWETADGSFRRLTEHDGIRDLVIRDGERGWSVDPSGSVRGEPAPGQPADHDAAYYTTVLALLRSRPTATDSTLEVRDGDRTLSISIDRETGLPRSISEPAAHETRTTELADWRVVDGVKFPFELRVTYDGREDSVTTIENIARATPPPGSFARPPDPVDTTLKPPLELPFEIIKKAIHVRASVNGSSERFIVDTGAPTVIDDKRAAALGLTRAGQVRMTSIRGQADIAFARGATLELGGATLRDQTITVADVEALLGVENAVGLLGYQLFARLFVDIDFARSVIRFGDSSTPRPDPATAIPFTWSGTTPVIETTLELADGRQLPAKLMIDSGCACEIFTTRPFATANLQPGSSVSAIRIATHRIENPAVVIPTRGGLMDDPSTSGLAGLVLLQRFRRVVFDYHAQLLWLER